MNRYPLWKYCMIAVITVLAFLYALPNVFGEDPAVQISAGSGVVLESTTLDRIKNLLNEKNLPTKSLVQENDKSILVRFTRIEDQLIAQDMLVQKLGDAYTIALNLAPATPLWLRAIGAEPMKLGLDLRGGVHFLLAIDVDSLIQKRLEGDVRNIRDELRAAKIHGATVRTSNKRLMVQFRSVEEFNTGFNYLKPRFGEYEVIRDSSSQDNLLVLGLGTAAIEHAQSDAVEQTTTILRNRINELGVTEPIVQRRGADRIAVDLPGIQDTARAKQILGGTASIELRMVDIDHDAVLALENHNIPVTSQLYTYKSSPLLLEKRVVLSGTSITGAVSSVDEYGQPSVQVRLGGGGEAQFYRITKQHIGHPMSIVFIETKLVPKTVDGHLTFTTEKKEKIISVATIKSALSNNFQITGLTDNQEALDLALFLRSGALPAPISIIEESTVGPSMGKDNILKGVRSVEIGFALIVVFMLIYYRFFGLAADLALLMNLVCLIAIMSMMGATLTLPGIAGILLTLGMSVDANVLIFERIREELRNGVACQTSIHAGFDRAFSTIVDANITTLIAAVALFALGSGAVKGFAVTLSIGLLTSMFTAIMGTRSIINLVYGERREVKTLSIGI